MSIKKIFDRISGEPGTNKKMEILAEYKTNGLLKQVLYLANSRRVKYYLKQIPVHTPSSKPTMDLLGALAHLELISKRKVTGNDAIAKLQGVLNSLSHDDAYIIVRIIEKDCKIGMGTTNMNKVFGNFIEDTPYMGAKSFSEEGAKKIFLDGPAYSQIKMDGRYANAIISDGDVEMESRSGEITRIEGARCLEELKRFDNCVLNGELTIPGIPRYKSNGIIASLISIGNKRADGKNVTKEIEKFQKEEGMTVQHALDSIQYTIWDMITLDEYQATKSSVKYKTRLQNVVNAIAKHKPSKVVLIESVSVTTYEQAMTHFQKVLKSGEEGTILKSANGEWKDGKPNWQVKMKLEMDVDLIITGFNYGTVGTKNEHVISSFNATSSDGKVVTRPQGLKEDVMKYVTANQKKLLGTIIECKSCGLSHDSEGNYSLLHPVFSKFRDDKNTCDSLESIKEIEDMAKGLKQKQKA